MINLHFGKSYRDSEKNKVPPKSAYKIRVNSLNGFYSKNHAADKKKAKDYPRELTLKALFSIRKSSVLGRDYIAFSKQISCPDELINQGLVKKIQVNRFDEVYTLTKRGEKCVSDIMKYASQRLRK